MIEVSCSNEQQVRFVASPMTSSGAPAPIDGALQASVDDASTGTALPGVGNLDVVVRPLPGFMGDITGVISADANMSTDPNEVTAISDTYVIHVTSAMAVNLGVTASPEPQV